MNDESPRSQSDKLLQAGILAFQAGDRVTARRQLAHAALVDPNNADAWLWLGRCVDDPRQQQECRERARRLNQPQAVFPPPPNPSGQRLNPNHLVQDPDPSKAPARSPRRSRRRLGLLALALLPLIWMAVLVPRLDSTFTKRWTWSAFTSIVQTSESSQGSMSASGIIEADETLIASETGGLIVSILPAKPQSAAIANGSGTAVKAGDRVVQLDTTVLDAQIRAARAAVSLAEAHLDHARAGVHPSQIAVAEAELLYAERARLVAAQAVTDTAALVQNPQDIRLQIALLEAQAQAEQHRLAQNLALKNAAEVAKDAFQEAQGKIIDAGGPGQHKVETPQGPVYYTVPSLPLEAHLAPNLWWQTWVGVNATAAQKEGLEALLAHHNAERQNPQAFKVQADEARATLAQVNAQVLAAQARLSGLRAGATPEQLAALQARVDRAQAALDALQSSRAKRTIRAPTSGIVLDVVAHPGEVAAPGATLLTLADLSRVRLAVYVPQPRLGQVHLRQTVQVTVDSFPGRTFEGRVTHIADRAEFTPRNVATKEERANLVFAVEIDLPNQENALKPGMPADAVWNGSGRPMSTGD